MSTLTGAATSTTIATTHSITTGPDSSTRGMIRMLDLTTGLLSLVLMVKLPRMQGQRLKAETMMSGRMYSTARTVRTRSWGREPHFRRLQVSLRNQRNHHNLRRKRWRCSERKKRLEISTSQPRCLCRPTRPQCIVSRLMVMTAAQRFMYVVMTDGL